MAADAEDVESADAPREAASKDSEPGSLDTPPEAADAEAVAEPLAEAPESPEDQPQEDALSEPELEDVAEVLPASPELSPEPEGELASEPESES